MDRIDQVIEDLEAEAARLAQDGSGSALGVLAVLNAHIAKLKATRRASARRRRLAVPAELR
jgi:hypothetical protein